MCSLCYPIVINRHKLAHSTSSCIREALVQVHSAVLNNMRPFAIPLTSKAMSLRRGSSAPSGRGRSRTPVGHYPSQPKPNTAAELSALDETPDINESQWTMGGRSLFMAHWVLTAGLDLILWASVFFRDYSLRWNMTISHYILVLPMSDICVFWMNRRGQHWYQVFRVLESLQVLFLTLQLWRFGIDGDHAELTLLRTGVCVLRGIHALWCVRIALLRSWWDLVALPVPMKDQICDVWHQSLAVAGPPSSDLVSAVGFVIAANVASSTHNNFQQWLTAGPLTGFQSGDAVNLFLKLFIFDRALPTLWIRGWFYFFMGFVLAVQWPFMFTMFSEAPWPYAHIVAELGLFSSAAARFLYRYRHSVE
jgi:hypothetical protein